MSSKILDLRWKKHILISESSMQQYYFNTILVVGIFFHVLPHCAFADDVKTGHFFLPRTQTIHGMPRNSQWVVEFSHVSKTNYSFNYPCAYALYLKSTGSSITYIYIHSLKGKNMFILKTDGSLWFVKVWYGLFEIN